MTWEQILLIVMLAFPVWLFAQVISADGFKRIENDELLCLGVIGLWNGLTALVLYLGGFWS